MEVGWIQKTVAQALDAVFPRTCPGCGRAHGRHDPDLCWECRADLSVIALPLCSRCGEAVHGRVDHDYVCQACTASPPPFRTARAAIHYNLLGKRLVTDFKYRHALWLERLLADLLETCIHTHYGDRSYDLICPVPLHPVKRRERGFNQSEALARALGRRLHLPLAARRNLVRMRMTPSQTRLTAGHRLTNVMGAFKAGPPETWAGKRVLLVDDVMTTGATVGACAKALLAAGAAEVDVVTVARGV